MSDEADMAAESQQQMNDAAVAMQVKKSREAVTTLYVVCVHCEENLRPKVINKFGHAVHSPNCARCMDELGIEYQLADS